jgi:hypothetical protein
MATGQTIEWWLLVPAFAVVLLDTGIAFRRQTQAVAACGMLVGFSLLTLWSAGRYFFPAAGCALILFAATMLGKTESRVRRALWFFWGLFAVFAFNAAWLKLSELVALAQQRIEKFQLAPAVYYGTLLFIVVSAVLLIKSRSHLKTVAS